MRRRNTGNIAWINGGVTQIVVAVCQSGSARCRSMMLGTNIWTARRGTTHDAQVGNDRNGTMRNIAEHQQMWKRTSSLVLIVILSLSRPLSPTLLHFHIFARCSLFASSHREMLLKQAEQRNKIMKTLWEDYADLLSVRGTLALWLWLFINFVQREKHVLLLLFILYIYYSAVVVVVVVR